MIICTFAGYPTSTKMFKTTKQIKWYFRKLKNKTNFITNFTLDKIRFLFFPQWKEVRRSKKLVVQRLTDVILIVKTLEIIKHLASNYVVHIDLFWIDVWSYNAYVGSLKWWWMIGLVKRSPSQIDINHPHKKYRPFRYDLAWTDVLET